jgi:hypothetical protein
MNKQLAHLFWTNNKLKYLQKHNFWVLQIYHSGGTRFQMTQESQSRATTALFTFAERAMRLEN